MRTAVLATLLLLAAVLPAAAGDKPKPNTLTPKEIADGWILLFDGETTFGWKADGSVQVRQGLIQLGGEKSSALAQVTQGDILFGAESHQRRTAAHLPKTDNS